MSDIPVIFSTNAAEVGPQIAAAARATEHADGAQKKFATTIDKVTHAIEHLLGRGGRHIEMGEKMGGVVGKLVVAYVILEKTMRIVDAAFEKYDKHIEATIENEQELEKAIRKTNMAQSQRGLDFAKKEGSNIRKLTSTGGLDLAKQFANKTGDFGESSQAVMDAKHRFGSDAEKALNVASRISNVTGASLDETVKKLSKGDLDNPEAAGQRIGRQQTRARDFNFKAGEQAINASATVAALNNANKNSGAIANNDLGLVSQSGLASGTARSEAIAPLATLTAEKFAASMEKLQVLQKISENTGWLRNTYEFLKSPGNSAAEKMTEYARNMPGQ